MNGEKEMAKKIRVNKATHENFKDFGHIISRDGLAADAGNDMFNWWDKLAAFNDMDSISVNILEAKKRDLVLTKMEHHINTPELVLSMEGQDAIIVVAPAGEFDDNAIEAFYLEGGMGVVLNTGVRHFIPYPMLEDTDFLIVFKDNTGSNDLVWEELSERCLLEM